MKKVNNLNFFFSFHLTSFASQEVNQCEIRNPCKNGATCIVESKDGVHCNCASAFTGKFCELSNPFCQFLNKLEELNKPII